MSLVCLLLLAGCTNGPTLERWGLIFGCPSYGKVYLASTLGYVSEAKAFFDWVDDSLPDGQCVVATKIYTDYQ